MFSKGSLVSQYQSYTKSIKCLKVQLLKSKVEQNIPELLDKAANSLLTNKVENLKSFQRSILNTNFTNGYNKSLYAIQDVLDKKQTETTKFKRSYNNFFRQIKAKHEVIKDNVLKYKYLAASTVVVAATEDKSTTVAPIPEPPPVPTIDISEAAAEVASQINSLGEPTFASLGLGGYTPVGLVQNCFEYFHVTLGIPWWEAIVIGTVIIRFCMFPLVIIAQRNAAKMNNNLPQMQVLQLKMTEARQTGNQFEAAKYSQELMLFMKDKKLNPFKNMIVPLAQMPVFISFFIALRKMANTPVESLKTGGLWWFEDLTVPDQFFLMPIITSLTLWATIELGTDSAKLSSQNLQTMKYVLRALPVVIFPFIVNFPGAILCYWVSSNFISLVQVGFLKIPAVRAYFDIDALVRHNPENLPVKPKGFTEGIKDSWTNIRITQQLEERSRLDEIQFQRAGRGPLVKTYKYDPTKQTDPNTPAAVSAKKR